VILGTERILVQYTYLLVFALRLDDLKREGKL